MFFWNWAQRRSKKGDQMVMARRHGHELQSRWTEGEWPPVQRIPPGEGRPGLERNHAYHCRLAPAVFLSARCNHDLSILLRLPVLDERLRNLLAGARDGINASKCLLFRSELPWSGEGGISWHFGNL